MPEPIKLYFVLENPNPGVDFGIQKGSGSIYETIQKQRSAGEDLHFYCELFVKPGKDGEVDFSGPCVQGPTGVRFFYVDIGNAAGQVGSVWSRRLKIPLKGIEWDWVEKVSNSANFRISTNIAGKAKDGGPNCGTVKPFAGWSLNEAVV